MKKTASANKPKPATITTTTTDKYVLRFLTKLVENSETGCLEYQGACSPNGYGQFFDGQKSISAHRYSYLTFVDDLPANGVIMHSCANKKCAAWFHLTAGTHKQNSQDASAQGLLKVQRRTYRKATDAELSDIRARAKAGESLYSIGKLYDRAVPYISSVVSGKLHDPNKTAKPKKISRMPKRKPVTSADVMQEAA